MATATKGTKGATTKPATPEPSEAPTVKAGRYASDEVAEALATRVMAAKEAGFTRPALAELLTERTGQTWTLSAVWRAENRKVHADEVDAVTALVESIEQGKIDVPTKTRTSRVAELERRVQDAALALDVEIDKMKVGELRQVIRDALGALGDVNGTDAAAA